MKSWPTDIRVIGFAVCLVILALIVLLGGCQPAGYDSVSSNNGCPTGYTSVGGEGFSKVCSLEDRLNDVICYTQVGYEVMSCVPVGN